jgi:O-methyltransferase
MEMNFFKKHLLRLTKFWYSKVSTIKRPIDERGVEVLDNPDFRNSLNEIGAYSLLDTDRLANLWEYCRLSNPEGSIFEIGSYKGGGILHLSNAAPERSLYIFDSFAGFESINTELDKYFNMTQFKDTSINVVRNLFMDKNRSFKIINGFFPDSFRDYEFPKVSFVHLDVDVYKATLESLLFLDDKMMEKSFIVIDDYNRGCDGVNKAVNEFINQTNNWRVFPLFPSQALLIHKSWFGS